MDAGPDAEPRTLSDAEADERLADVARDYLRHKASRGEMRTALAHWLNDKNL